MYKFETTKESKELEESKEWTDLRTISLILKLQNRFESEDSKQKKARALTIWELLNTELLQRKFSNSFQLFRNRYEIRLNTERRMCSLESDFSFLYMQTAARISRSCWGRERERERASAFNSKCRTANTRMAQQSTNLNGFRSLAAAFSNKWKANTFKWAERLDGQRHIWRVRTAPNRMRLFIVSSNRVPSNRYPAQETLSTAAARSNDARHGSNYIRSLCVRLRQPHKRGQIS